MIPISLNALSNNDPVTTSLYYFTGTGNSLAVARRIAGQIGNCDLFPIPPQVTSSKVILPVADRVGIVCPVYSFGLPAIVAEFASRVMVAGMTYRFAVLTKGGIGDSALKQLDQIFYQNSGVHLDAGFTVNMPTNYVPSFNPPQGPAQQEILARAETQIAGIVTVIKQSQKVPLKPTPVSSFLHRVSYPFFSGRIRAADTKFTADSRCNHCNICALVCPVKNITYENNRPVWNHRCELCFACFHFCPTKAIEYDGRTAKKNRYHHPEVSVDDMKQQQTGILQSH